MKYISFLCLGFSIAILFGFIDNPTKEKVISGDTISSKHIIINNNKNMKLGAFSVSLSVKDIKASKTFYENLGFTILGGDLEKNYLIMKNENSLIGLFQGMFEDNILTFNPGWDEDGNNIDDFTDIRKIQSELKSRGIAIQNEIDETTSGPVSITVTDPDGNVILLDQHR